MLNRRGFVASLLATAAAPAFSPLPLRPLAQIVTPAGTLYANRTIRRYMDIAMIRDRNVLLTNQPLAGGAVATFRSIPIRIIE